jgi:plastocyanin
MRHPKSARAAAVAAVALIGLSGCGSSGGNSDNASGTPSSPSSMGSMTPSESGATMSSAHKSASPAPKMAMAMVTIKDFAFQGPVSVAPGAKVMVTNDDSSTHSVTSDQAGLFDVDVTASGGTATFTAPTKPGSYPYHCKYHGNMQATLVVK